MGRTPPAVTEAELAVLEALWNEAPQTARQLAQRLYPPAAPSEMATIQKLLQRLEGKGLVVRDRSARTHTFSPAVAREEYAGGRLAELAERLSDGSLTPLLMHLVAQRRLSDRELAELRRVLDEAPRSRTSRKPRKGRS
jgi:BlaI family transcriptional regulator, penicillinase repressor